MGDMAFMQQVLIASLMEKNPELAEAMAKLEGAQGAPQADDIPLTKNDTQKRLYELARAVGACEICWGEDPICAVCLGRGRPGSRAVDPIYFRKYLIPAYRHMRTNKQNHSRNTQMRETYGD